MEKELKRQQDDHQYEAKTLKNKMEANEEFLKQEHNLSAVKVHVLNNFHRMIKLPLI